MRVAVIGSGRATRESEAYAAARAVGRLLAERGHTGTLSELGYALDMGRPVAGIETHDCSEFAGFEAVETPAEAVESIERRV